MMRLAWLVAFVGVCALGSSLFPRGLQRDYGRWRVVVVQSDDWGLEGWVPDSLANAALPELVEGAPAGLEGYAGSTLERGDDVDALVELLSAWSDLDGLPPILQANTIVAAVEPRLPSDDGAPPSFGFSLRMPGQPGSPYERPRLWDAVRRAEALGVWRAELHGLTHLDLSLLRERARAGDELFTRAQAYGVVNARGLSGSSELGHRDSERERIVMEEARARFHRMFGREPVSVIAADYRWSSESEAAWRTAGIKVVQAKAEQRDPGRAAGGLWQRLSKRLRATADRRRGDFLYLDRVADLEPYGDAAPDAPQGAQHAVEGIRAAWARGEPGIVSIHRLQLVHLDTDFAAAGRAQLRELFALLEAAGGARFLVDAELEQLERRSVSLLRRGDEWVIRNFSPGPRALLLPDRARPLVVPVGNHRIAVDSSSESSMALR